MTEVRRADVIGFYDTHPINEDEILAKLRAAGRDPDRLTQADMGEFDQDHYGGVQAVRALAQAGGIAGDHRVLDVCSGMGGPARWLADNLGCRVTGLDFTRSRVEGARRLTERVGMSERVDFVEGDATAMPLPAASFDVVIGQEAWCHVPDKAALIGQVARVLVAGGTLAFTDIMTIGDLEPADEVRLARAMQMPRPAPLTLYRALLEQHGFTLRQASDLSDAWKSILIDRLAMYRSLRDTTVAKFGEARYAEYDGAYAHFVDLFVRGVLGGYRVVATLGS